MVGQMVYKKRNNIAFKTVVGEAGLVDNNFVEYWIKNILPKLIKECSKEYL